MSGSQGGGEIHGPMILSEEGEKAFFFFQENDDHKVALEKEHSVESHLEQTVIFPCTPHLGLMLIDLY